MWVCFQLLELMQHSVEIFSKSLGECLRVFSVLLVILKLVIEVNCSIMPFWIIV